MKEEWNQGLNEELQFWRNRIKNIEQFPELKAKLNPDAKLQEIISKFINPNLIKNKILDVGAGPMTVVNKKCDISKIEITAIDSLAEEYNKLLKENNIMPIVKTEKCDGENISSKYSENTFDIVYSRNAIDHSYNPLKVIFEMIKVVKRGGFVIVQSFEKEGSHANWRGLHKWNFYIKNSFLLDKKILYLSGQSGERVNVFDCFRKYAKLVLLRVAGRQITCVFRKI